MKFINTARQMGKTTKIIEEMKKNPKALMITHSMGEAIRIIRENPDLDKRVVCIGEYHKNIHRYSHNINEIHIDNLELCLRIGHRIGLITMTNYPVSGEYDL